MNRATQPGCAAPEFSSQLKPIHLRHMHIQDSQLEWFAGSEPIQNDCWFFCILNQHAPFSHLYRKYPAVCFVVVHHDNMATVEMRLGAAQITSTGNGFLSHLGQIVKLKVEPFPYWLSTRIWPPINSLSLLLMANPSPVPP